ncbi:hypothetical protein NIES4073_22680 [Kalymmatonema gypsitolerans NIES-4073]|nr:hypothetical protein NIES4073_22680 [Scytonema sp. NIES-4073]
MRKQIEPKNSELFLDLSEEKQEIVTGGGSSSIGLYNFVLQMTNIRTFANSEATFSDGSSSTSYKQETGYMLSQLTFGFSGGGGRRGRKSKNLGGGSFLNMLFGLLSLL